MKSGLPPIAPPHARLLLLGSLPGDASLAAGRYYAHPRNQFWRLVGGAIGCDLAGLDYDARLTALADTGIALWDVVGRAQRAGSLDTALRDVAGNDVGALVQGLPRLRAIGFNGGTAARIGARLPGLAHLRHITLPSSSPAYTLPLAEKQQAWNVIAGFLPD